MEFVIKASQMLLSLSILIVIHEMGHFIPAKLFKTRVEKFYLFFNPWFSLFKRKFRGTEYGIGWIPLGGFVKITGMIDENLDKDTVEKAPESWEFRAKPAYQRFIILIGGVTMNIICALVIYSCIFWYWGYRYLPLSEVNKHGISTTEISRKIGLRDGDKIISVDDHQPKNYAELQKEIILGDLITVERNSETLEIHITDQIKKEILQKGSRTPLVQLRVPFEIAQVFPGSLAAKIGLQPDDIITSVNDTPVRFFDEYKPATEGLESTPISLTVMRGDQTITQSFTLPQDKILGVSIKPFSEKIYELSQHQYSLGESIPMGWTAMIGVLSSYVRQFKLIFNSETEGYKQLGGFISIGKIFPSTWDWKSFWQITAFISIMLAFMNVLPIPALDGGHLLFVVFEMITRKKPGAKLLESAQKVGMAILLLLLIFANANDIIKLF